MKGCRCSIRNEYSYVGWLRKGAKIQENRPTGSNKKNKTLYSQKVLTYSLPKKVLFSTLKSTKTHQHEVV